MCADEFIHKEVGETLTEPEFDATNAHAANNQTTNDMLYASSSTVWKRFAVAASRIIGRKSSGTTTAMTGAETMVILSGQAAAAFAMNSQKITGISAPATAGDALIKGTAVTTTELPAGSDIWADKLTGTAGAAVSMNSQRLTSIGTPTTAADALIKGTRVTTAELPTGDSGKVLTGNGASSPSYQTVPVALAIFGDGSDGTVTINSNTSLTRDMFYSTLTVDNTYTLTTDGYRIFVSGTLTNNGTIIPGASVGSLGGGADGGVAGGDGGGVGGKGGGVLFIAAKLIDNGSGIISANGVNGGNSYSGSSSGNGAAGPAAAPSLGGGGGSGGSGGSNTGGAGGAATAPTAGKGGFRVLPFAVILKEIESTVAKVEGGAGGGGGAAGDSGTINGGGGGGGGGCLVLVYNSLTTGTETANGGSGGSGQGGGSAGNNGSAGTVIKIPNA